MTVGSLSGLLVFMGFGIFLVCGAYRRWAWLVDPPTNWWPFYSQSAIKKLFGTQGVLYFTYFVGGLLILSTAVHLVRAIARH